ncbi:hypothetical protein CBR_g49976 [Chara braunii]|uniref:G-protein coupled receptors family 3 profile domain-containing protein n=1 Tax=Chara braunii TaxID=69332 RepID=A0A388K545_CHABU|nr:hypothetical protein CBR_g49976 [Chara braunii]|eukprot:GBG65182.1 hypothetical protein CBR_g49976 [Chara braunii]
MAFALLKADSPAITRERMRETPTDCPLVSEEFEIVAPFADILKLAGAKGKGNHTFKIFHPVPQPKEYTLVFVNCFSPRQAVSMNVRIELFNKEGTVPDFLPAGKTQLPKLYFSFFALFVLAGVAWVYVCYRHKETTHRVHILMGVLVSLKAITLLALAAEYTLVKQTGTPHGWNVAYYIFSFLRGVMLFTVILLIGTGWSFLKPFLQDRDKKVILIVIPLQVFANIAATIVEEYTPAAKGWFTWRDIFHLIDIICCCTILLPIVWSIKHLREASRTDGKAARNMIKLSLFRQFYVMVVSYIYFTRIVVYLLRNTVSYHYTWVSDLADNAATLIFYILTGYIFRPVERNPYFVLDDEEEEAAVQMALKDDEFDL